MSDRPLLPKLLSVAVAFLLVVTLAALVYGHAGAGSSGLSLADSYITE